MTRRSVFAAALPVVWLLGCSDTRPAAAMIEVSGRVTVNGRPAEALIMNLSPLEPGTGRPDECVVRHGAYRAKVMAGHYRVSFAPCPGGPVVPAQYRTAAALVLDGTRSGRANFELE